MGRIPRSEEDINNKKTEILEKAIEIIESDGYEGFSIRKLGPAIGVAPKTIYNYFKNKDEIYLHVLTRGFELLYDDLHQCSNHIDDPYEKLVAMTEAYVEFGFKKSNYYDIMLTLYVPKANDYIGTPQESLALNELQTALSCADLFIKTIERIDVGNKRTNLNESQIRFTQLLIGMHGIVALKNNTILDYLHENPDSIIDHLIKGVLKPYKPH